MDNELKDILYYLDWSDEKRFIISAARKNDVGNWELCVKRDQEPSEADLSDICYVLQIDDKKTYYVLRAQRNEDGSWNLELKRKGMEAANDNN